MIRNLCAVTAIAALTALAACGDGGARAPAHASQSQPAAVQTTQVQISPENRRRVEDNIRQLLGEASAQFAAGKTPVAGAEVITAIQPASDHQFAVELQAGIPYTVVGACDADCTDVDIELLDGGTGQVVASDLLPDDYPVVNFAAPAAARYFVRVILKTCTQSPCYVGARVLQ
ncbi:MAG: hypothetical protein GC206_05245 [Alphaproteobacteria bacterium]|nr:hypothetical protein [Alphaproteobacteria bacterium]